MARIVSFVVALVFLSITQVWANSAMLCKDHPAYKPSLRPVIVSSWDYKTSTPGMEQLAYIPRYTGHVYAPVNSERSPVYKGLDLFHTANMRNGPTFRMYFQRAAKVYMLVDVTKKNFDATKTAAKYGWKSEGWVKRVGGPDTITYGVQEKTMKFMSPYAYVFSTNSGNKNYVDLPQTASVKHQMAHLDVTGSFNLLVAESNGRPSEPVGSFNGRVIEPNTPCPSVLHDTWKVPDDNKNDPTTRGKSFTSWHPQWDPCYWCAYDHEHGSSPKHIMGYTPKFTYTAFKNDRMDEPDEGFKGFVIREGENYIYFSLHAVQSNLRRVGVRFHTINIAIVNARTKELMADLQHKGDFGFAAVRLRGGKKFRPIFRVDKQIEEEQRLKGAPNSFRSINILDEKKPNREYAIRKPILIGQYEVWQTLPMCSKAKNRNSILNMQFKLPNTGIKSTSRPDVITNLGRKIRGTFYKSTGLNRSIKAEGLLFAQEHCPGGASGTFYTDPTGTILRDGPGMNNVRQYIKAGFTATLSGRFETTDRWTGLHLKGRKGFFADHGHGIDADRN